MKLKLYKIEKIFFWIFVLSVLLWVALFWNIGRWIDAQNASSTAFEGFGMTAYLLFYYFIYMFIFVLWLIILIVNKDSIHLKWKRVQLILIFVFSIIPTLFIDIFLIIKLPKYKHHIVYTPIIIPQNGKVVQYSNDSIKLYEAYYVNDTIVGQEIERYESGQIRAIRNYKDGVMDGVYIAYYENGNKRESRVYNLGNSGELKSWYENGTMSYYYNPDSIYSYRWWDNGQLQEMNYRGYINGFWKKDGTQTVNNGNGIVSYYYDNDTLRKSCEISYSHSKNVKEESWSPKGNRIKYREFIHLSEEKSKKIGFSYEFRGYKSIYYYENGSIEKIYYNTTSFKYKGKGSITYEYSIDGKLKDKY